MLVACVEGRRGMARAKFFFLILMTSTRVGDSVFVNETGSLSFQIPTTTHEYFLFYKRNKKSAFDMTNEKPSMPVSSLQTQTICQ